MCACCQVGWKHSSSRATKRTTNHTVGLDGPDRKGLSERMRKLPGNHFAAVGHLSLEDDGGEISAAGALRSLVACGDLRRGKPGLRGNLEKGVSPRDR